LDRSTRIGTIKGHIFGQRQLRLGSLKEMTMMGRRVLQVSLALAMFSVPCFAQVQPGSAGGSVGKIDKSVSGGEEPQTPPPARAAPKPSNATPAKHAEESGGCGRIAGTWTWSNNLDVVVKSNRTADATNGGHAVLTCDSGMYVFNWNSGNATRMTLAADGRRLSGMGSFGPESAVRK
jgi:hypothetical protein